MAEGANDAELLKEKANKYFKGNLEHLTSQWIFSAGENRLPRYHCLHEWCDFIAVHFNFSRSRILRKANAAQTAC